MVARKLLYLSFVLLVPACASAGAKADLETVTAARSLLAELALLEQARSRLTDSYSAQMRREAARDLAALAAKARQGTGPASAEIAALATLPADPSPAALNERIARARAIESRLEGF